MGSDMFFILRISEAVNVDLGAAAGSCRGKNRAKFCTAKVGVIVLTNSTYCLEWQSYGERVYYDVP